VGTDLTQALANRLSEFVLSAQKFFAAASRTVTCELAKLIDLAGVITYNKGLHKQLRSVKWLAKQKAVT